MATLVKPALAVPDQAPSALRDTISNALIITRREVRDSFRDWRILVPILTLTFLFPILAQFVAGKFTSWVTSYGADIIGERTIPFMLMIVGFFPISISLVIALETFVGEKERRSLEPLLSTPLSNTELYVGKTLAAMIPPLVSSYGGMGVYLLGLVLGDLAWRPPVALIAQVILLTTVQALVMVTGAVVVSSQTTSTRAANLLASFIVIPVALLIQGESAIMFLAPDANSPNGIGALWAIIAGMVVVVFLLLRLGNSLFNREELLGRTINSIHLKTTLKNIGRQVVAVNVDGRRAQNVVEWYRRGIPDSLRRIRQPMIIAACVFFAALIGGIVLGFAPGWQLPVAHSSNGMPDVPAMTRNLEMFHTPGPWWIFTNNLRILAAAMALSIFTFGVAALVLTPAAYVVMGYIMSQLAIAGYSSALLAPAVLPHGIIEIPVIIIATAAGLRLGGVITRPPDGMTVGSAWTQALADTIKLSIGVILPGLVIAALIEAYITPLVIRLALGG